MIDDFFSQVRGTLSPDVFTLPTVAVNITKSIDHFVRKCGEPTLAHVLAAAQEAWRMNVGRAEKVERILAYYKRGEERLVLGAFAVDGEKSGFPEEDRNGCWLKLDSGRMVFHGYPAIDRQRYELYLLPPIAPGARNPVKYYDEQTNQNK